MIKITNEEFIKRAKNIHGDKYCYLKTVYKSMRKKIIITCYKHGDFEQKASNHLNGAGCIKCSRIVKRTNNDYMKDAIKVHGDKYDYSIIDYRNNKSKIKIICSIHGIFNIRADHHLHGIGCKKCLLDKMYSNTDDFIIKAKNKHGDIYNYSLVRYKSARDNIDIICSKHGIFEQQPYAHLNGNGCPICRESKGEKLISKWLLENEILFKRQFKFKDCRYKRPLPFDFYLPKQHILIEYDGELHFEIIEHFGGIKKLEKLQRNDKIKTEYCINNNIKLIRIKYTENIEKKLRGINER